MLPAAGVGNHLLAEYAGRSVEIEEIARARPRSVLQNEMAVQQHGFHFGQEAVVAVQIAPTGLHHPDVRVGEIVDGPLEKIGRRAEVRIENGDELSGGRLQPFLEGPGFKPGPVRPVVVFDGIAESVVARHQGFGERRRIVVGIVQHLNL